MHAFELFAMLIYFGLVFCVGFFSYKKHLSAADFIIGGRSMNSWLTALAAHASDMSSWLFMAYPAAVLTHGIISCWTAIGLIICMYLNWQLIAPKIRVATEKFNSYTFSSFFESRLADTSGRIRVISALVLVVFYTIYISAGLIGLGRLLNTLLGVDYTLGIVIGILIVIPYVFTGGYLTLAWIDLFQGMFLMGVIVAVPLYLLPKVGGMAQISAGLTLQGLTRSLVPDLSSTTLLEIVSMALGWGIGYFGQPHIVTKFMGIRRVEDIRKSKWIGMSWMVMSLGAATLVGLVGIPFFHGQLGNSELVFIDMVRDAFHPFIVGFILCAVLAATINAMGSQVLVLSSSLTEDFYKRTFRKDASSKELLLVSRIGVIAVAAVAFLIAALKVSTIYILVEYAWAGIGSSFGPLVISTLYGKQVNRYGAWAGILSGGIVSGVWPYINGMIGIHISPMLPGFFAGLFMIFITSYVTRHKAARSV
jgi:sodium/proline symporter